MDPRLDPGRGITVLVVVALAVAFGRSKGKSDQQQG